MTDPQIDLSKAKPFIFELSFDAEDMAERRRQKIEERERQEAEAAAAAAVDAAPTFSEEDLAAAKAQAYEEGRAAGLADASSQREAGLAGILDTIGAQIAGLHVHQDVANEKLAADLTELGRTVMAKLLPHYTAKHGIEEVTSILGEGFTRLVHEQRISITVGQEAHDMLEPRIEAMAAKSGYDGRLKLVADPDMGPADVFVNWGDGRLAHVTDEIWAEIDSMLETATSGMRDYADQLEQTAPTPAARPSTPEPVGTEEPSAPEPPIATEAAVEQSDALEETAAPVEEEVAEAEQPVAQEDPVPPVVEPASPSDPIEQG